MLGLPDMNNEEYSAYMDAHIANMAPERREALINAIKLIFSTFVEDETQGVLVLLDKGQCMTTMGLNATYEETERLVSLALGLFARDAVEAELETKH